MTNKNKPMIHEATLSYLERAGLRYLERYAASSERVRTILMNKVRRSAEVYGTDLQEGARLVERLIQRFIELGLIRDRDLALVRAEKLHEKGASRHKITAKLLAMGLAEEDISAALDRLRERADGDIELKAAWALARRKRMGPFRSPESRRELRSHDLGVMARSGFSYSVARRVIDAEEIPGG
ncbi:MAG: RecX family transcriptional regulator [Myxococcales bacterium]|nr:RecX family transcriptional regulator [Polyangiaceae bacterium]MDW8249378.1 RecX family transcriptional regulator [Myxococcales bacterium]